MGEEIKEEMQNQEKNPNGTDEAENVQVQGEGTDVSGTGADRDEIDAQKALAEDYFNRLQRMQADFENFKRRARQEKEDLYKYASENLMIQLLPVIDNFERAMATAVAEDSKGILSGVEMIYRQLKDVLEKEGLKCIETIGCEFDPNFHEAIMQVDSDEHPANNCVEELQKGYMLKEKVIRPAMVKVAK